MKQLQPQQLTKVEEAIKQLQNTWAIIYTLDPSFDHTLQEVRSTINNLECKLQEIIDTNGQY